MKTKMNIRQIAGTSIASFALLFLTSLVPVQANDKSIENNAELAAATVRLDNLSDAIETSLRFIAPAAEEMNYFELEAAEARLDELNSELEKEVRFEAPVVDAAAELEVNEAVERLDSLNNEIERSIRFEAPAAE